MRLRVIGAATILPGKDSADAAMLFLIQGLHAEQIRLRWDAADHLASLLFSNPVGISVKARRRLSLTPVGSLDWLKALSMA